ncbi:MAG TPA: FtsX-like permease family protein [Ktedonobacterales bacterium]|nr:FtsX-like permease family protein [Ktedonobacterales bacterium]
MDSIFSFSTPTLLRPLLIAALAAASLLAANALRVPHLARIGVRGAGRRPLRSGLIVFGLMLSTMFVASSLAVDDTISTAVKTIAVFNLGRVDEDVVGGVGQLGVYNQRFGGEVVEALADNPHVSGVAPALVAPNLLLADETARQVRGGVTGIALVGGHAGPLGDLRDTSGRTVSADALDPSGVYLSHTLATALNAHRGDALYLYSTLWPGQRFAFTVRAVVTGGPLGDMPATVLPLGTFQQLLGTPNRINHVYIANTGDGLTGVGYSPEIARRVDSALPRFLHVDTVKQDGIDLAVRAEDIFGRILTLYTSFALAIGLLLIFLIFALLAAERRAELGMVRALGMRRSGVVAMLLYEGATYDAGAALAGMLAGLGLGVLVVRLVSPVLTQLGFPLKVDVQWHSMAVAFCLGFVFTLITIWLAAWSASRMTVAAALRDLPEPPTPAPSLLSLARDVVLAPLRLIRDPFAAPVALARLSGALIARGIVPLLAGRWLLAQAEALGDILLLSLGVTLLAVGGALLLRWGALVAYAAWARRTHPRDALLLAARARLVADRLTALLVGGGIALYWALPLDAPAALGLPRFNGGIETFFVAGVMMVAGAVWALAPNLDLLLAPLRWLLRLGRRRGAVARIALVYPAQQRFRTGVALSLFTLVCFTMVVMATIAASTTQGYDNLPAQSAGYDVAGQPLFAPVGGIGAIESALRRAGDDPNALAAAGSATPLPLGILQPGAPNARWSVYPVSQVDGSFLDGVGLPLVARAAGYASDAAVWQAVRTQPGAVVIDAGALSPADYTQLGLQGRPSRFRENALIGPPIAAGLPGLSSLEALHSFGTDGTDPLSQGPLTGAGALLADTRFLGEVSLRLRGVVGGPGEIAPTPIWVSDLRGGPAIKLHIVGIVRNDTGERTGLLGSPATFAHVEGQLPPFGNQYYYFKVAPGVDAHAEALALGSALLDDGFETTVLQDLLLDVNGPRVFISRVLVALVGLTLLVGMAALAVSGSRAVVERRQQIGMLRALGFRRAHVQAIFLVEALLIGAAGTGLGLLLGLALCRSLFAADFFEQFSTGLTMVVPWHVLAVACAAALAASALAAALPAWQAGRVTPADALRYE